MLIVLIIIAVLLLVVILHLRTIAENQVNAAEQAADDAAEICALLSRQTMHKV